MKPISPATEEIRTAMIRFWIVSSLPEIPSIRFSFAETLSSRRAIWSASVLVAVILEDPYPERYLRPDAARDSGIPSAVRHPESYPDPPYMSTPDLPFMSGHMESEA
jgi:hypothetical protein